MSSSWRHSSNILRWFSVQPVSTWSAKNSCIFLGQRPSVLTDPGVCCDALIARWGCGISKMNSYLYIVLCQRRGGRCCWCNVQARERCFLKHIWPFSITSMASRRIMDHCLKIWSMTVSVSVFLLLISVSQVNPETVWYFKMSMYQCTEGKHSLDLLLIKVIRVRFHLMKGAFLITSLAWTSQKIDCRIKEKCLISPTMV